MPDPTQELRAHCIALTRERDALERALAATTAEAAGYRAELARARVSPRVVADAEATAAKELARRIAALTRELATCRPAAAGSLPAQMPPAAIVAPESIHAPAPRTTQRGAQRHRVREERETQIIALARSMGGSFTAYDAIRATGLSHNGVYSHLGRLVADGRVRRVGVPKYRKYEVIP